MPSLSRITGTFFVNLINRLGVRPPPPNGFELSSVIQPVSIVDADIPVPVFSSSIPLDTPAASGATAAPAAGTVLAAASPQVAGTYLAYITIGADIAFMAGGGTFDWQIQRRSAAATTVWAIAGVTGSTFTTFDVQIGVTVKLLAGESLRVVCPGGSAAGTFLVNIFLQQIT